MADTTFAERMAQIEGLLRELQESADPHSRARTTAIVQGLLDLHAAAIEKMVAGMNDAALLERLAADELIGSMLLLYGLHPRDLDTRVQQALELARPILAAHGGNVELVSLDGGVARLRLLGSCHGCPSSAATLRSVIEDALYARAPDLVSIEVEGESSPPLVADEGDRFALPLVSC